MKRLVLLRLMVLVVIGVVLLLFDVPGSYAWPTVGECPSLCTFVGTDCMSSLAVTLEDIHIVQGENDNELAQCSGDTSPPPNGAIVCHGTDLPNDPCTGGFPNQNLSTSDWTEVISASGQVTLTCHFKLP